ncbi:hypothetical protein JTB14_037136 [Gonioctena quinquepunctata]|nr:hypothetical protein JTB14_037136 [Gonioctena quinquepunctata]
MRSPTIEELMRLAGGIETDLSLVKSNTRGSNSERIHATPAVTTNVRSREANTYRPPMLRDNRQGMQDRRNNYARDTPPRSYNDYEPRQRDQVTRPNRENFHGNARPTNPTNSGNGRRDVPPAAASRPA